MRDLLNLSRQSFLLRVKGISYSAGVILYESGIWPLKEDIKDRRETLQVWLCGCAMLDITIEFLLKPLGIVVRNYV